MPCKGHKDALVGRMWDEVAEPWHDGLRQVPRPGRDGHVRRAQSHHRAKELLANGHVDGGARLLAVATCTAISSRQFTSVT